MRKNSIINAMWMMSEKVITLFGLFFVTSFVAKYIGPSRFGQLALAIAIFQVVQVVAQLGCDNIIFKRVSQNATSGLKLIYSSFAIRAAIYIFIAFIVLVFFYKDTDFINFVFLLSVCIACFFTSMDVFTIYNDATLNSKFNTIANVFGLIIGLVLRYIIAFFELPIHLLSLPIVLTTMVPFIIRLYFTPKIRNIKLKYKRRYNSYLFATGIPLVISTISMTIYSRVNQFSLSYFSGSYELGIYSVALTLGTAWVFIGNALSISFLSKIYSEKDEFLAKDKTSGLIASVFTVLLVFPVFFVLFGKRIIFILYGNDYLAAYNILVILCLSTIVTSLGFISNRYIVKLSGYNYLSKKTILILLFSIPISIAMVYQWGLYGAAYSVLIIELLSLTIMNYFFREGVVLKMHLGAFNLRNIKKLK
ncbi:oligosaccharide flippase family protein [Klebsiella quasipneumoniae subsp. similipneumoniae]|uniref:oligosaccharide flippase family protein n=1 Tax=Klebsiella quasipneumoniae TaxID=1463165 RepID=UPI0013FD33B5|nr:oligosaccharide flippase family protein [Klebsiella quasipneumoniae]NHJ29108.1 oligosaccharide flippase family protein [Klebsiella quasipneumoniae subsp. similipneumoniae]NHJ53411.1 oligosaccharide flippase family protein [Klebsiella quasipneumoniae subsp. similipneumoniae]NHJ66962.1 oligosaccharide flippase family protein [Klebsiella quasipneumoniae subsp. similipneumoniae]NHJ71906.1 oligosaccharide flippase family protein [Klebsiella quasipneumoniae subsp. similipneumoniae]NHJ82250.1 olig